MLKITTIQVNMLLLAIILAVLQAVILYFVNGELVTLLQQQEFDQLAVVFAPVYGIIWSLKQTTNYKGGQDKQ